MIPYIAPGAHELSLRPWVQPLFTYRHMVNACVHRGARVLFFFFNAPGTFFICFFEFGQGHRGPIIPYCPGAP
ncbi:unnamed protein product, partial [Staurois parvus]